MSLSDSADRRTLIEQATIAELGGKSKGADLVKHVSLARISNP